MAWSLEVGWALPADRMRPRSPYQLIAREEVGKTAAISRRRYRPRVPALLTYDDLPSHIQHTLDVAFRAADVRRYDDAIPGLSAVVDAYPAYLQGVFVLGTALRATGDRAGANQRFTAAAAIAPDDPRVCLGLAWARLDDDDPAGAAELAARGLPDAPPPIRADLLAVLGMIAEAEGRAPDAARAYLEAYEAGTMLEWLKAHCRLAGVDYVIAKAGATAPWPITAVERRWLYATVSAALATVARGKDPAVADERVLVTGCDGTTRQTAAWAARAGVDRARLYQALASRGGYCDCEVVMNASSDDDDARGLALVVGTIEGALDDGLTGFDDLRSDEAPDGPAVLPPRSEAPDHYLGVFVDPATQALPLQITDGNTVGEIVRALAERPPEQAQVRLLFGFAGEAPAFVVAGPEGIPLRTVAIAGQRPSAELARRWPELPGLHGELRARLPARAPRAR